MGKGFNCKISYKKTVLGQQQKSNFEKSPKMLEMEVEVEWDMKLNLIESIFIWKKHRKKRNSVFWDIYIFVRLVQNEFGFPCFYFIKSSKNE